MRSTWAVIKRTLVAFYDDQMTHHAAALTYYSLMSLFPAVLLGLSLLALIGQYPATYDAIIGYLRDVVPESALAPLDASLEQALRNKGSAVTGLVRQRRSHLLRDHRRARGGPAGAQRGLRERRRSQLPAPQVDRHRLSRSR